LPHDLEDQWMVIDERDSDHHSDNILKVAFDVFMLLIVHDLIGAQARVRSCC
jgi:hypothetical protein